MVELCVQQITRNISNIDFSLAGVFDQIPLSTTYFMKLFKQETGMTPNDYMIDKRMDYAAQLLSNRHAFGLRIKDVSQMCGYDDQYYFSRIFKKKTGYSPNNWPGYLEN